MKKKIYLVEEGVDVMGDLQMRTIRAFLCKHTAKKFTEYKKRKLLQKKMRFQHIDPSRSNLIGSKTHQQLIEKFRNVLSINEYYLKEVDLY